MTGQLMHLAARGTVLELRETNLVHGSLGVERPDVPGQKSRRLVVVAVGHGVESVALVDERVRTRHRRIRPGWGLLS
jgi:hypothetical protein